MYQSTHHINKDDYTFYNSNGEKRNIVDEKIKLNRLLADAQYQVNNMQQQYNKSFNILDLFNEIDQEAKGYISTTDLEEFFDMDDDLKGCDFKAMIRYWTQDERDNRLSLD